MTLRYESEEFSEELKKRLNASSEFREKAKGMSWKILTVVSDIPFAIFSTYADGMLVERKHVPAAEIQAYREQADFIVEVPTYELSIEMATGKQSLATLFLSGKIKVEGSIFKAMKYQGAMEEMSKITAALANESVLPSKEEFTQTLRQRGLL
ncbi:MAG: SCP2 sterol-binding domain-containing protein [Candidatus Bathyarchaeia archaeon]